MSRFLSCSDRVFHLDFAAGAVAGVLAGVVAGVDDLFRVVDDDGSITDDNFAIIIIVAVIRTI